MKIFYQAVTLLPLVLVLWPIKQHHPSALWRPTFPLSALSLLAPPLSQLSAASALPLPPPLRLAPRLLVEPPLVRWASKLRPRPVLGLDLRLEEEEEEEERVEGIRRVPQGQVSVLGDENI